MAKTAPKTTKKAAPKKAVAKKVEVKKAPAKKATKPVAKASAKKTEVKKVEKKEEVAKKSTKKVVEQSDINFVTSTKDAIIKAYAQSEGDTGSPEVQIALLTQRIFLLQSHLKGHKKDNHSRRGLLQMVGKRRRLLEYLKKSDSVRHQKMLKAIDVAK